MKKYVYDIVLILAVLIIILFFSIKYSLFNVFEYGSSQGPSVLNVSVNGELVGQYSIKKDAQIPIDTEFGYNNIVIKDGKVSINKSSCHNKLCINSKEIWQTGEQIICLPNRLVLRIIDNGKEGELDAIAY